METGIVSNLNIISLDPSEIESLDVLAAQGKQHRFNSPAWKTDFVRKHSQGIFG